VKSQELKEVRRLVGVLLSDLSMEPGHRDQLRLAERELDKLNSEGKWNHRRIFKAAEIIATLYVEDLKRNSQPGDQD
jgi:hypothetical protein